MTPRNLRQRLSRLAREGAIIVIDAGRSWLEKRSEQRRLSRCRSFKTRPI